MRWILSACFFFLSRNHPGIHKKRRKGDVYSSERGCGQAFLVKSKLNRNSARATTTIVPPLARSM
jgi:hypothetical protein